MDLLVEGQILSPGFGVSNLAAGFRLPTTAFSLIQVLVLLLPVAGLQTDMSSEGELSRVAPASTEQLQPSVATPVPRKSIHEAAAAGDLNRLIEMLAADPFFRGYRGRSLLHMAARTGIADVIRTPVSRGVDVTTTDPGCDQSQRDVLCHVTAGRINDLGPGQSAFPKLILVKKKGVCDSVVR